MEVRKLAGRRALGMVGIIAAAWLAVDAVTGAVQRRREAANGAALGESRGLPVEEWTARFTARMAAGDWAALISDLESIDDSDPDLYRRYRLGYLHARALLEGGEASAARQALQPFLAAGDPFRDLALFHAARAAEAEGDRDEAARFRETLVTELPQGTHRQRSLEDLLGSLTERKDAEGLAALAGKVGATADAATTRDLEARIVEALVPRDPAAALERGLRLLRTSFADDPADRVSRAISAPELVSRMGPEDWALVGEAARNHRHFDTAIDLLQRALPRLPGPRDELLFAIGRAQFAKEDYAAAEATYLEGAGAAAEDEMRASFFYQASRCAQLLGADARAEEHLASAIRLGGRSTRASAALTQRLRIRVQQRRYAEALADLRAVRRVFPKEHAVVEATLPYAIGMVAAGRFASAIRELEAIRPKLLTKADMPEVQYWKARALEKRQPRAAVRTYLKVLRADTPTHFAYFARRRLTREPLAARAKAEIAARRAEAERWLRTGNAEKAREAQTDAVLLAGEGVSAQLQLLRAVYRELPAYRGVMELSEPAYPKFPLFADDPAAEPGRFELLLAQGLFDDAVDLILTRYPLHPLPSGLARAEALRRGGASRASIYAAEVMQEDVPDDFVPQMLPRTVRELLYPRYFYPTIREQAARHGADPRLVLAIMREESRFNPRAKSPAAARGLLQFIITTAREVGRAVGLLEVSAEDLYDPEVVIQLGAKYVADLLGQFEGNAYKAAAAYNAGPNQARLWSRLAPLQEEDAYLSSINFDETKNYVRKVLNSYERYGEIYENAPPAGGVPAEP